MEDFNGGSSFRKGKGEGGGLGGVVEVCGGLNGDGGGRR